MIEAGQATLFVIGESRLEEQLDKALTRAEKSVEKEIDVDREEFKRELDEAEKEYEASQRALIPVHIGALYGFDHRRQRENLCCAALGRSVGELPSSLAGRV